MSIKTMTLSHIQNIPYVTTLNDELRNPAEAKLTRLLAAESNISMFNFTPIRQQAPLTEDANIVREKLNKEFEELTPTLFKKTGYRGVASLSNKQYEIVKNLKPGDIVKEEGFAYFSKYKTVAKDFAKDGNSVLVQCNFPFLSKVSRMICAILQVQNEQVILKSGEIMTPAGSSFRVLKNTIDKNGLIKLVIKYLK